MCRCNAGAERPEFHEKNGSRWCRKRHAFQGRLWPIIHQTDNYWWWDVDLWVWHALQTSSEWMAFNQWAATKKTTSFSVKKKVMLTVFMDYRGVVHHEFLAEGQTVNKEYYLGIMRCWHEAIRQKKLDLWANNSWILHHDNAPSHNDIVIREHLAKNEYHPTTTEFT